MISGYFGDIYPIRVRLSLFSFGCISTEISPDLTELDQHRHEGDLGQWIRRHHPQLQISGNFQRGSACFACI